MDAEFIDNKHKSKNGIEGGAVIRMNLVGSLFLWECFSFLVKYGDIHRNVSQQMI